ncbi:hypothetical protein CXB51_013830 [Gossypium anomalum]|uniref:Endonuclease/exonuclease/phosphatase domain-containing protein n=1 Tax=Gossypium anomalum TaxID=47600 RepID=A0A8J5YX37_9ROSI|nr:hypothetical protein CXB51_013830 [Gossypium anomalum]
MMEVIRKFCGYKYGIDVCAGGSKGGLSLGWKEGVDIRLRGYSKSHIDIEVMENSEEECWRFTGFYGSPIEQKRKESWNLLRQLKGNNQLPWLVMGDFNEILFSFGKRGGRLREERQMVAFREALEDCELNDLGFSAQWYTWERGRLPSNNIRERLDMGDAFGYGLFGRL